MIHTMAAGLPPGEAEGSSRDVEPETGTERVESVRACTCWGGGATGFNVRGERGMSDTKIWGPCGHEWINFGAWVIGDLDEGEERGVEAQLASCGTCWDQLEETITVSALLYKSLLLPASSSRVCRNSWPPRDRR
jgi:hypothetical protein